MTGLNEIYKCNVCGNVVEVLHTGAGELVCCGEPMERLAEKSEDEGNEKHVPVIERDGDNLKVKVGSVPHPMTEEHMIEFIEIITENGIMRKFLKPGQEPVAEFNTNAKEINARELCNVHGLWKS